MRGCDDLRICLFCHKKRNTKSDKVAWTLSEASDPESEFNQSRYYAKEASS
jgi:hypothetical protein